jgi:hypothetical protein
MKLSKEFNNGILIFIGISIYFALMDILGFSDVFYLRFFNVFFVFYGVNKTVQMNLANGNKQFVSNAVSAISTALVGVFLSVIGLVIYSYFKGGDAYVQSLSKTFLFGGNPSVMTYSICLLFEGIASSVIVTLMVMLFYNNQYPAD